jgi:hypothetical protein
MATADQERGDHGMDAEVSYWRDEIQAYERLFEKFSKRGRKIVKKYKDTRTPREDSQTRYNILWANVQTRLPVLYARNPKVVVERRYRDSDPVGRVSSEVLERSIQFTLDHVNDAWQVNRQAVLDFELPGRATVWVRYVPHFKKSTLPAADLEQRPPESLASTSTDAPINGADTGGGGGEIAQLHTPGADGERPHSSDLEINANGVQIDNATDDEVDEETLSYEETKLDYVYWEDYGHSWARVDDEVRGKWRRVYMDREELEERFSKSPANPKGLTKAQIDSIPLDWSPKTITDAKIPITRKKAIVYEIWDKRRRTVLWIVKNFPRVLDKREDALGLDGFFPCPRPLMANLCNDDLNPVPNFAFYQDQANEIDELSTRIVAITKALKVAGVRDTSAEGLDRLLSEGVENQLVPVEGWNNLKEKGGLAGVFELLPMEAIANTLESLREQRSQLIEDVYQLTGISDIVRGMSDPTETATAQQLKGQFSMVRIEDAQAEVQRFCRDEVRIIGQIVAGYDIETLKVISGVKLLTAQEKQDIQLQIAAQARASQMQVMAQQSASAGNPRGAGAPPGAPPSSPGPAPSLPQVAGPMAGMGQSAPQPGGQMHPGMPSQPMTPAPGQAPVSPEKMKLLELPTWEEVEALLKNPIMREFRLDIETDSTIRMDEEAEKAARLDLIKSVGEFIQQMITAGMSAPEILPMLGELLMFGIRAFKTARSVEQTFEDMMQALEKAAKQPKGPPPEVQAAQMKIQGDIQIATKKAELDAQTAQAAQQAQGQQEAQENQLEAQREQQKAQLDAETQIKVSTIQTQHEKTMTDLKNHFEAERVRWETEAKERIAAQADATKLKIAEMEHSQRDKDREHQKNMARMQHSHEKSMPKPQADKAA